MNELALKYGCNPNQKPSRIYMEDGSDLPVTVLNGKPGYINFLDALNSIQLVKELKTACGLPAAASFKHVSPAGAALGLPLTDVERKMYHIAPDMELSPLANAYARARGADRMSSFGDWIALSDICDVPTAKLIQHEVSDGIIAPGYEPEALKILAGKKKGNYNVVAIDPDYKPAPIEHKQVYGITFEQGRNELVIGDTPEDVIGDDVWAETFTEQPAPLTAEEKKVYLSKVTGVCLGSDAFFPFGDNIERARRSGVTAIVQPGGSIRDQQVIDTCNKYDIAMAFCGLRLFHH